MEFEEFRKIMLEEKLPRSSVPAYEDRVLSGLFGAQDPTNLTEAKVKTYARTYAENSVIEEIIDSWARP